MENRHFRRLRRLRLRGIQPTIMIAFSVISISTMFMVGAMLYIRFATLTREKTIESTERMMEQASEDLEDYLGSMRRISDTAYYNIIKERDFAAPGEDIQREINILYEANRDSLRSIAVYNDRGSLIAAEPIASQKERSNVTVQDWYKQAVGEMENMHFSTPHIQNLFDDGCGGAHKRRVRGAYGERRSTAWSSAGRYGLRLSLPDDAADQYCGERTVLLSVRQRGGDYLSPEAGADE